MSLKSLLNNKVSDDSFPSRDVTGGMRVMRTMKFKKFTWDEPGDWTRFEELLDSIDASDIVRIQFSSDLRSVAIVWNQETRHIPRKEYDAQLPVEAEEPPATKTATAEDLFNQKF